MAKTCIYVVGGGVDPWVIEKNLVSDLLAAEPDIDEIRVHRSESKTANLDVLILTVNATTMDGHIINVVFTAHTIKASDRNLVTVCYVTVEVPA